MTATATPPGYLWCVSLGMLIWNGCRVRKQSNRCFSTKAVAIWRQLDDKGHIRLVADYLREVGSFENVCNVDRGPRRIYSDLLYAVIGESAGTETTRGAL